MVYQPSPTYTPNQGTLTPREGSVQLSPLGFLFRELKPKQRAHYTEPSLILSIPWCTSDMIHYYQIKEP